MQSLKVGAFRSIGSLSEPYSAVRMRLGTFSVLFLSLHGLGWLAKLRNWLHFKSMHVLHRFAEARAFNYCKSRLILSTATFIVWTPCSCCQSEQTMMHPYAFRNMRMGLFVVFFNLSVFIKEYRNLSKRSKKH